MKFPAVAIAICFTSGIAMGLWPMAANRASSRGFYFGELAAVLLAITLRTCSLPSRWIKRFSFALLLAAAVTMATFPFAPRWQRGSFELSVLDVGQGDSLFLVFPVGHHGSKNSAIPEFLAAVQPRLGVITSGEDNPYRHPSPQLLERLRQAAIPTLRTDTNGAIHIITDG